MSKRSATVYWTGFSIILALLIVAQIGRWRTITIWTAACVGLIALLLIGGTRLLLRLNLRRLRLRGHNLKKLLIIGTGSRAEWFAKQVIRRPDLGYRLVGYVDSKVRFNNNGLSHVAWLGDVTDLPRIISDEVIDLMIPVLFYWIRRRRWERLHGHAASESPQKQQVACEIG